MFAAQFIFRPGEYDDEFYRLDASIDEYALGLPGFLGVERWVSVDGATKNSIYYFDSMDTITKFARFEDHRAAKQKVQNWYNGYQVVISEVKASYGDGQIDSIAK
jgi:heme-degrading monooxygenase HmoA